MTWTHFHDMHSGGGQKLDWAHIFIEAPEDEAKVIFYNRFGNSPDRITCTCCGEDYSVSEAESLEQATAYNRNCAFDDARGEWVEHGGGRFTYGDYIPLDRYLTEGVDDGLLGGGIPLVIRADEIADDDRRGAVPEQGYVWVGE